MIVPKILNIAGFGGSGKSLLQQLLDGHSEIITLPVHAKIHDEIFNSHYLGSSESLYRDIREIRKCMHCKGYYNLEIIANHGHLDIPISGSKNIVSTIKFDFDFYTFDKSIITSLIQSPLPWNHNSVIEIFYSELIKFLPHPNIIDEENVYLTLLVEHH